MADDDMYDDDDSSSHSSSAYRSYGAARWAGGYSPPATPPRPQPVLRYDLKFEEGMGGGRRCM
jgi:hypothetical protein